MSIWWLVGPTLAYLFLTHKVVNTVILAIIAAGLHFAQTRPEVPADARPYLPALQILIVSIFLGVNIFVVGVVVAAAAAAYSRREALFKALDPWWEVQARISPANRRIIAVVASLVVGYWFGSRAGGNEWTYTFISVVIATIITFLCVFTPGTRVRGGLT